MRGPAAEHLIQELSHRAASRPDARRPHHPNPGPRLLTPDLDSIEVLSERATSKRCAVAATVNDIDGNGFFVMRAYAITPDGLRAAGGSEGPEKIPAARRLPDLSLYAYASGTFFAAGRVQSGTLDIAHVRLVWKDHYQLQDTVENQVLMFFGNRATLEPATVEFLDPTNRLVGCHQIFGPEERRSGETYPWKLSSRD